MSKDDYLRRPRLRSSGDAAPPPEDVGSSATEAVPGQVLVKMRRGSPNIATAEADFIDSLPTFGTDQPAIAAVPSRSGQGDFDAALDTIGATALWRVAPPPSAVADTRSGAAPLPDLDDLVLVEFDPQRPLAEVLATLADVPTVVEAGPSGGFTIATVPNDPGFPRQWGLVDVRCPQAWELTTGDPSVVVAVLDTGCDLANADLDGQFAEAGTSTVPATGSAQDDHGHGTHVAGIVAAIGDNATDVAGVAWRTTVLPVKVLTAGGTAVGTSIAQGIAWAAPRCSVINCSLQGGIDDIAVRSALDGARRLGVVVVAAMGNYGWGQDHPSYPAAYAASFDNVLAVGAVDRAHRRAVWSAAQSSNTGSWIGVAAPGTGIDSLKLGGGVTTKSGTSQACPHVAGAAALIRAVAPDMPARDVVATITGSARPLRDAPGDPVPNPAYGYGLLDLEAALLATGRVGAVEEPAVATAETDEANAEGAHVAATAALGDRALLHTVLATRADLLDQFLRDPDPVLGLLGLDESALLSPSAVPEAHARGGKLAAAMAGITGGPPATTVPALRAAVEDAFGPAFRVAKVPFGLRFAEPVPAGPPDLVGTATVEYTFGVGARPDVDP